MPRDWLGDELLAYGVQNATILDDSEAPEKIEYLDLLSSSSLNAGSKAVLPQAVAERQGRPLLYVINSANLGTGPDLYERNLKQLRRTLASRGEQAYLGILEPGKLSVMPISLHDVPPEAVPFEKGTGEAITFYSRLSLGEFQSREKLKGGPDYVFDEMFNLLEHIADDLIGCEGLDKNDILSLIGRALFLRFLCDRKIVKPQSLRSVAPSAESIRDCFATPESAAYTCEWLDRTFNGDFLPLTCRDGDALDLFGQIDRATAGRTFVHLSAIMKGDLPTGRANYQQTFEWAKFDFAHVPVGLLSQVYEAFSRKWSPDAKETSVHYTPRRIAEYLVEEAFADLPNAMSARVLDPACGAGVFLVLAFRRLYQARWKAEGQRPGTAAIRNILENQIAGFEISEAALRLTALSLYLTAIELDPDPVPPSKLGFKNLRGRVLFNWRRKTDKRDGPVLGSLGQETTEKHYRAYDVILCNPPWTSLKAENKVIADEYTNLSREVMRSRGLEQLAEEYQNPDSAPDLPFVWRSTDWCRSEGRIGMVLPGRVLFKQERVPRLARETLFKSIQVNGILNCSNLADTPVWPEMNQPFFLLFAQNHIPERNHHLRWVTPHCDLNLNRKGEVRIDSKSVDLVSVQSTFDEPWLWKALTVGTSLDVDVIRKIEVKIKSGATKPLLNYWKKELGLSTSSGYSLKLKRDELKDAAHLHDLKNLDSTSTFRFVVDTDKLEMFTRRKAGRPRGREVYRQPLVLVKRFPSMRRDRGWALLSLSDVAYRENFHGFSGAEHPNGEELVRFLHLFVHSYVWMHRVLITSPKMGVERREFYKRDLDTSPFIRLETLNSEQRALIWKLSERLIALEVPDTQDPGIFEEIDTFFAGLYGLGQYEVEVIRDTLETALPFKESRERACERPTDDERQRFVGRLESSLRPFLRRIDMQVSVRLWQEPSNRFPKAPYSVVLVGTNSNPLVFNDKLFREEVLTLASESGASLVVHEGVGGLVIALLDQYRYWTQSRARLCAGQILLNHMGVFER